MVLRNLDPPKLVNGSRLVVQTISSNVVKAVIITGEFTGDSVNIRRVKSSLTTLPFAFTRIQYPIKLSFSITINKRQGQNMKCVGIDLTKPCFAHGQLYVALSRVHNGCDLHIFTPDSRTTENIIYKEALLQDTNNFGHSYDDTSTSSDGENHWCLKETL